MHDYALYITVLYHILDNLGCEKLVSVVLGIHISGKEVPSSGLEVDKISHRYQSLISTNGNEYRLIVCYNVPEG